jgi:hypothetical protein
MDKKVYDMFDKINEGILEDLRKTNIKFPECDAEKHVKENKKQMEENAMLNKNKTSDTVQKILSSKVNGSKTSDTVQKILSSKVNNK